MKIPAPHFLLFSESHPRGNRGDWRFVLQSVDGLDKIEAADVEPNIHGQRLELLSVVRGLEALERPSRVTIVTPSKYVSRGILNSIEQWRENDWQWESFGQMVPVKNQDLWRRVDRAMAVHQVECKAWRFDNVSDDFQSPDPQPIIHAEPLEITLPAKVVRKTKKQMPPSASIVEMPNARIARPTRASRWMHLPRLRRKVRRLNLRVQRRTRRAMEDFYQSLAEFGTGLLPKPWFD